MLANYFVYYNFCRVHQTLRVTPAMEAGIANHVWEVAELIALLESKSILDGHKYGLTSHQPPMTRILWIIGLSIALLVFGGWTILIVYAGISHRHLNSKGLAMLICNGGGAWFIFQQLRQTIRERKPTRPYPVDSN